MGWVWRDDESDELSELPSSDMGKFGNPNFSSNGERCSTRKVVRSKCNTEEVEPGKFIRKCEKTQEVLRDCVGRPVEVLKSNKEYTEEDVTEELVKGSYPVQSFHVPSNFHGLQNDLGKIERDFLNGMNRFFEAAEGLRNDFFGTFKFNGQSPSSPSTSGGVNIEGPETEEKLKSKRSDAGYVDLSGLSRDV